MRMLAKIYTMLDDAGMSDSPASLRLKYLYRALLADTDASMRFRSMLMHLLDAHADKRL